jgi:hypothetical protein
MSLDRLYDTATVFCLSSLNTVPLLWNRAVDRKYTLKAFNKEHSIFIFWKEFKKITKKSLWLKWWQIFITPNFLLQRNLSF